MQRAALIWHPDLAAFDLGRSHPLDPLRLTLTLELMNAYGILDPGTVVPPRMATEDELLLVHSLRYIEAVREASDWNSTFRPSMGLGTEDNPIFPGMHEVAALTCGASIVAIDEVLSGRRARAFSIAGGLHHAHRDRAAGFSVYNDPAVAIAVALRDRPGLRVLYVDVDAHHSDGVQEAFIGSADVLTISVHGSGTHSFPGTGFPSEIGHGAGEGFSVNVPLPAFATDECFRLAFDDVVVPLAQTYRPDIIVAQVGIDAQHNDPQTDLGLTLPGYHSLVCGIKGLADELCEGRLAALGGGGYNIVEVVPLAWTWVMAELLGVRVSDDLPDAWREHVCSLLGVDAPRSLGGADEFSSPPERAHRVLELTAEAIREVRSAVFPRHGLSP